MGTLCTSYNNDKTGLTTKIYQLLAAPLQEIFCLTKNKYLWSIIMKILKSALCAPAVAALGLAVMSGSLQAAVIIDDSFADGDRASTGALDADWWSSSQTSGSNVQADPGSLTLVTGTSGRGMHATFAPQTLAIGDTLSVTYAFTTPTTVGTNKGTAFKIALMDFDDAGLAADQSSSSSSVNPLYVGQAGYMTAFDIDPVGGGSQDTDFRKHDILDPQGRFLGTTSEWDSMSSSSDAGYAFAANTDYVGVFSITRTGADSLDLFSSLGLDGGALLDSHTTSDSSAIANNFGMLGFWVNSDTFGSSNSAGDLDNGLIFTNVTIDSTVSAVPVPGAVWLFGSALVGLSVLRRKRS